MSLRKLTLSVVSVGALLAPVGLTVTTAAPASAVCIEPDGTPCPTAAEKEAAARTKMIKRAKTWMTAYRGGVVPYSQSKYLKGGTLYSSWASGRWRTDCSGYASMALQIANSPWGGTNTQGLATTTYTKKLSSMNQLAKGDLVIDPVGSSTTRHVVIFEKWKNASNHSQGYWAYEQRGTYGTTHRVVKYGIGSDAYDPYSPKKLNF